MTGLYATDGSYNITVVGAADTNFGIYANDGSYRATVSNALLNNYVATVPPAATDDSGDGYAVGSEWLNTTTGGFWRCIDATASAAVWERFQPNDHPGYVSGLYYSTFDGPVTSATPMVANRLYIYPYFLRSKVTISELGVRIATGVDLKTIRIGVWANQLQATGFARPTGVPLVVSAEGTISGTGAQKISGAVTPNVTLPPAVYWFGLVHNSTATPVTLGGTSYSTTSLIGRADIDSNNGMMGFYESFTYGSLAAHTLDNSTTYVENSNNAIPLVYFKVA